MIEEEQLYNPNDRPTKEKDELHVNERIVNRILNFLDNLKNVQSTSLTIAITGEWGIGKTSVMNLLINNLEKKESNIIIRFEPLLEGKCELLDIMELFYLKLYGKLKSRIDDVKNIFEKLLTSLLAIPLVGTTIKLLALILRLKILLLNILIYGSQEKIAYFPKKQKN